MPYPQFQPGILDPSLWLPTDCELLKNAMEGGQRVPIVFCATPSVAHEIADRICALMESGTTVITLPLDVYGVHL